MMSETSARARRLARWLGSFERNGLSGRRAAASPPLDGVGDDGVGGLLGRATPGTKGEEPVPPDEEAGLNGGGGAGGGVNGGGAGGLKGGGPLVGNSGTEPDGVGGVAVAEAVGRSIASPRALDAPEDSTFLGGGGGGGGA